MAAARTRAARRPPAGRVRWDRMGRIALLVILAGLLYLYIGPTRTYISTWQEARAKRAEVERLETDNARLRERKRNLVQPGTLEREARRIGLVRPGEKSYVIEGLPRER